MAHPKSSAAHQRAAALWLRNTDIDYHCSIHIHFIATIYWSSNLLLEKRLEIEFRGDNEVDNVYINVNSQQGKGWDKC